MRRDTENRDEEIQRIEMRRDTENRDKKIY